MYLPFKSVLWYFHIFSLFEAHRVFFPWHCYSLWYADTMRVAVRGFSLRWELMEGIPRSQLPLSCLAGKGCCFSPASSCWVVKSGRIAISWAFGSQKGIRGAGTLFFHHSMLTLAQWKGMQIFSHFSSSSPLFGELQKDHVTNNTFSHSLISFFPIFYFHPFIA